MRVVFLLVHSNFKFFSSTLVSFAELTNYLSVLPFYKKPENEPSSVLRPTWCWDNSYRTLQHRTLAGFSYSINSTFHLKHCCIFHSIIVIICLDAIFNRELFYSLNTTCALERRSAQLLLPTKRWQGRFYEFELAGPSLHSNFGTIQVLELQLKAYDYT